MRRRVHLEVETKVLEQTDRQYGWLIVTGWHVDTDGTNAAVLRINGKNLDWLTAPQGHKIPGAAEAGGIANIHPESGRLEYPITMSLSGSGASATIFCFEGI